MHDTQTQFDTRLMYKQRSEHLDSYVVSRLCLHYSGEKRAAQENGDQGGMEFGGFKAEEFAISFLLSSLSCYMIWFLSTHEVAIHFSFFTLTLGPIVLQNWDCNTGWNGLS